MPQTNPRLPRTPRNGTTPAHSGHSGRVPSRTTRRPGHAPVSSTRGPRAPRSTRPARRGLGPGAVAVIAAALAIAFFGILHVVTSALTPQAQPAQEVEHEDLTITAPVPVAWDLEGFDRTHLIDDDVFYNYGSMSEQEIRSFIDKVNSGCMDGRDGVPCLAKARFDTPNIAPSDFCPDGYVGAAGEDVATIVSDISLSCRINPRVLLVLMQKEQGLLTASGTQLTASRYRSAAGYACPDGTVCDEAHAGLFNQLYGAASQFQRYRLYPSDYQFVAGVSTTVPFSPHADCGGMEMTIENQATAGLYNYTPYTPSDTTLAGQSDRCATWGNLAFYGFWTTWFGPPFVQ